MATMMNPFDLLGDVDAEDPSQLIAVQHEKVAGTPAPPKKAAGQAQQKKPAQLPTRPAPPAQAVREAYNEAGRGQGRGGGRGSGRGRGGSGFNRDSFNENSSGSSGVLAAEGESEKPSYKTFERRGPRGPYRGGRRGGFSNGEAGEVERPRRVYERRSGTGTGSEIKREGSGRGNWGTPTDELAQTTEVVNENEKNADDEKTVGDENAGGENKENVNGSEEKEPEDKEMTLEEYEKILEEKRKALQALKTEERKVDSKEFQSMQLLSNKKANDDIFVKLGSQKDKRKEAYEKDEKAKKSVSITEFLKPAEGEGYYRPGGRGRGRGRNSRGFAGSNSSKREAAPSIEDPTHFPTLGGK